MGFFLLLVLKVIVSYPVRLRVDKQEVPGRAVVTRGVTALDVKPIPSVPGADAQGGLTDCIYSCWGGANPWPT